MSDIRKYDYSHISQRRIAIADVFFTSSCMGIVFFDLLCQLFPLFPYLQIMGITAASILTSHLVGTLLGKTLFRRFRFNRFVYILTSFLLLTLTAAFLFRYILFDFTEKQFQSILSQHMLPSFSIILLFFVIAGVKNNYLLKVSCGTFFDEKNGSVSVIFAFLSGLFFGALLYLKTGSFVPVHFYSALLVPSAIFLFIIKLDYTPVPFLAKNIDSTDIIPTNSPELRDDIFFTYLNFSNIIIYTFLAGETIFRYYTDSPALKLTFFLFILGALSTGYFFAVFIRRLLLLHIYAEVLYPFLFMAFFLIIHVNHMSLSLFNALLFLFPMLFLFGMSFHHSTRCISGHNDHPSRYRIIYFSIFILPVPIFTAIALIPFSQIVFFIFFYSLAVINIIIPGLFIAQKTISELRKGLYFIFAVCSVPLFIFSHFYFSLPFSIKPFVDHLSGFDEAAKINLNTDFLQKEADVYINRTLSFHISDQTLRNLKQATASLSLFINPQSDDIIFIDGIHSFFPDPVKSFFKKAYRISYVPRSYTGITKISSSREDIATENTDLTIGLSHLPHKAEAIIDIPNIYDQKTNSFRFSEGYYRVIKTHMTGKSIFVQVLDKSRCDRDFFHSAIKSLRHEFKYGVTMLFGDTLVFYASDNETSLKLTSDSISRMKDLLSHDPSLQTVFYSEFQPLSHTIKNGFLSPDNATSAPLSLSSLMKKPSYPKLPALTDFNDYKTNHVVSLELFSETDPYRQTVERELKTNERVFTILKLAEAASLRKDVETETSCLLDLKKIGEYNPPLRQYALAFLSFREKTFFTTAAALESDKLWDDAAKIYRSILLINPTSFDANYRMSVISLTQQKISDASSYLQTAMQLQPNNANVMHQMGVLLFTIGKYNDALTYLQKAIALKKYDSPTYFYIGLCFEELNRLTEAEDYYKQAILKDPMNQDNASAIERIQVKLGKQNTQWQMPTQKNQNEVEHGEDFPLPINKSAIDVRLKDDNPGTVENPQPNKGSDQ